MGLCILKPYLIGVQTCCCLFSFSLISKDSQQRGEHIHYSHLLSPCTHSHVHMLTRRPTHNTFHPLQLQSLQTLRTTQEYNCVPSGMDQKYHLGPPSHFIKMELRFKDRWYTSEPGLRCSSSNTSSSSAPCFPPGAQGFKEVQKHLDSTLYIHHALSLYMKHCAEFQMCFIGE